MATYYTTTHLKALTGVTIKTVHNWLAEFERHLSPTARPTQPNKPRNLTVEDLAVLLFVAERKATGDTFAEIHVALDAGQRASVPDMTPEQLTEIAAPDTSLVERNQELQIRMATALAQIAALTEQVDGLRLENAVLKSQVADRDKLLAEIRRLEREIGKLENELERARE